MSANLGKVGTAFVEILLDNKQLKAGFENAKKDVAGSMKQIGSSMTSAGKTMTMALTLPILGLGTAIGKVAGDFEVQMNRVKALTGTTGAQFETLQDQARQLGATTQFSASQAAEGMGFLAQAGFDANEIIASMPATLSLAAAAQIELADAADVSSNILSGYGMNAEELGAAMDSLIVVTSRSNTNFMQLGQAMKFAGPIAKSAGVEFEETAAVIGLMGNAGIQASLAGTGLRGALTRLLNPTKEAQKEMERLGLQVLDSNGKLLPMRDILEQLGEVTGETGAFMEIFGQRAGPSMAAAASQGVEAFDELMDAQKNELGIMKELEEAYAQSLPGKLKALRSAFEELLLVIADAGIMDAFKGMILGVRDLVLKLSELDPRLIKAAALFAGITAAIGPLLVVFGVMASSLGSIIGLFGAGGLAGAAGSLGAVFTTVLAPALAVIAGSAGFGLLLMKIPLVNTALANYGKTVVEVSRKIPILSWYVKNLAEGWDILSGNSKKVNESLSDTEKSLEAQQRLLKEYGIEVDRGSMSLEEFHEAIREAAKQADFAEKPVENLTDAVEENAESFDKGTETVEDWSKEIDAAEAQFKSLGGQITDNTFELEDYTAIVRALSDEVLPDLNDVLSRSIDAWDKNQAEIDATNKKFYEMAQVINLLPIPELITEVGNVPDAFKNSFSDAKKETESFGDHFDKEVSTVVTNFAQAVGDMIWEWEGFGDALKDIGKKFISSVVSMFVQQLFTPLLSGIGGLFGFDLSGLFGGAAAGAASGAAGSTAGAGAAAGAGGAGVAGGLTTAANLAFPAVVLGGLFSQFFTDYQPGGTMPTGAYYQQTLEGTDTYIDPASAWFSGADLASITSNVPNQTMSLQNLVDLGIDVEGWLGSVDSTLLTQYQDQMDVSSETKDAVVDGFQTAHEDYLDSKDDLRRYAENSGNTYNFNIRTLDSTDFEDVVKTRIIPALDDAIKTREFTI